jgi:hypothetical protein
MCQICGWRKGGPDSFTGFACKCGLTAPPLPHDRNAELVGGDCHDPDCDACTFARQVGAHPSIERCINAGVDQRPYFAAIESLWRPTDRIAS